MYSTDIERKAVRKVTGWAKGGQLRPHSVVTVWRPVATALHHVDASRNRTPSSRAVATARHSPEG